MSRYECPLPVPDNYLRMIGVIAAEWEWVERMVEETLANIMEHEYSRVAMFLANMSFQSKYDLILAHARPLEKENSESFRSIKQALEALKNAYGRRNMYVHGTWEKGPDDEHLIRAGVRTRGGRLAPTETLVSIDDLNSAAAEIWEAGDKFVKAMAPFGVLPRP